MSVAELFEPVNGSRISQQIVNQILPLIRSGELKPGDRLPPERELATSFGVSRVTVRDALRVLEVMGLLEIRLGASGGAFITAPSAALVGEGISNLLHLQPLAAEEIVEARVLFEVPILRLALRRYTGEDLEALEASCTRARRMIEKEHPEVEVSAEFHRFHNRLAASAHNAAVELLSESFSGPLSMAAVRATDRSPASRLRTVEEHEALVEAIADRDVDLAVSRLRGHLLRGLPDRLGEIP